MLIKSTLSSKGRLRTNLSIFTLLYGRLKTIFFVTGLCLTTAQFFCWVSHWYCLLTDFSFHRSTAMTSRKASTTTSKLYQPITYPSITQRTNQPATTKQPITPKLYQPITNPPVTPRPYQPATNSPITQKPPNPATTTLPVSSQKPYQPVTNPPSRTTQKIYQPRTNPPAATTQKLYQPLTNPPASATRQPAQPINNIRGSSPKPYVPLTFMPVTQRPGAGTTVKPLQPATQIGRR